MFKQFKIAWGPSLLMVGGALLWQQPLWLLGSSSSETRTETPTWSFANSAVVEVEEVEQHNGHDDNDTDVEVIDERIEVRNFTKPRHGRHHARIGGGPYIGVRLAPLPEALAAHMGDEGLMVTNIVADSPADKAGLQRYDIIVSFDAQAVKTPGQLAELVNQAADRQAVMVVKRGQRTLEVTLTPQARKEARPAEWRYPSEAPLHGDWRGMRGMKVQRDEDGNWRMLDLGALDDEDHAVRRFDIDFDSRFPGRNFFFFDGRNLGALDHDDDELMVIERIDGDQRLRIERDDTGITVTRSEADGQKRVERFENDEQLRDADPDAHAFLQKSRQADKGHFEFYWPHDLDNLEVLRRDFQDDLRKQIDEAMRIGEEARLRAEDLAQEVREQAAAIAESVRRSFGGDIKTHVLNDADDGKLMIHAREDGSFRVIHRPSPNEEHSYRFESREAFAEHLPELHQWYADSIAE